ncbi:hypothetical protein [Dickeya phage Ds3CZ]|uniref:Uncharacterized protein n=3 Tax=Limestonevirus limestone TaxID=1091052 RepID=A0A7M3T420_9CAUD|nr:hypothetical protein [Dickeya phage Kamild]QHB42598.1 hypothetical protein [Dickeya phage Ds25CZ]QHB42828.1 hypothetical protein [Dickeya phage Ds3CZ]
MGRLIRVSKKSKGAEKRLYKAIRLMLLYNHKAKNHCWRQKTKERYMAAHYKMKSRVVHLSMKIVGEFKWWDCEAVGSRKAIDLEYDRGLAFLINVSNYEDLS